MRDDEFGFDIMDFRCLCGSKLRRIIWATDKTYGSDQHIGKNENQGLSEIIWAEKIE